MNGRRNSERRIRRIVLTGILTALVLLATMMIRIPVPMTQGYVHLGDAMIFLAVLLVGKKFGAAAAGLGSALADILGGFAFFAPWTFLVKFAMAFVMGAFMEWSDRREDRRCAEVNEERKIPKRITVVDVIGMILGGAVMAAGYFAMETVMYGSWVAAAAEMPWNIGQFAVGAVIACMLSTALYKTPARKYFQAHQR